MDIYFRSIVGWSLDKQMTENLVTDTLDMAFARRDIEPDLIVDSDRGVQYHFTRYVDFLKSKGYVWSMS